MSDNFTFSLCLLLTYPPPAVPQLSAITKLKAAYGLWQGATHHIPKVHRHTFGGKIDTLFLSALEILFRAQYTKTEEKLPYLIATIGKLDLLKFFLQIGWENKLIDSKKYLALSQELEEVGRMLGGWKKGLEAKLSPTR